ncbi:MAG: 6-phosphogluconolactonase [Chloroflexota bacterium]
MNKVSVVKSHRDLHRAGKRTVFVFPGYEEISRYLAREWQGIATMSIEERGRFAAALSGGNTPTHFYAALPGLTSAALWNNTHLFMVDERFVPRDDKASNYRMMRETLLDNVPIPESNVHAVITERVTLTGAAENYEQDIRAFFNPLPGEFPCFDFILLGIGEDGHTASLFPGTPALLEEQRTAVPVLSGEARHDRITLTLPVLNNARNVCFLVIGGHKADIVNRIVSDRDPSLPASLVNPEKGTLSFILDREAGLHISCVSKEART